MGTFRRRKVKPTKASLIEEKIISSMAEMQAVTNDGQITTNKLSFKKKTPGSRLWMRFDKTGESELMEVDKSVIIKRVSIPSRDLRILGPIFSHSSSILAREKAMLVNLEFIRVIVTAEEVLLLDPLRHEVLPFVDQLRQLPFSGKHIHGTDDAEDLQDELPFEFQVLEIALEVVCSYLDSRVAELEFEAYPVLDEMAIKVSNKSLELVRILKSNLTGLLAQVQKVKDEIEHLLDDNEDMAQLYLTRKWIQYQQSEVYSGAPPFTSPLLNRISSTRSGRSFGSSYHNERDVEDLEMLLEAYFIQLDGTRNKILSVREYIDDTEDYVNIQLDNQRNELIQFKLILTIGSFAINMETLIASIFGMNIPCPLYNMEHKFLPVVGWFTAASMLIFFLLLGYARWKKLL